MVVLSSFFEEERDTQRKIVWVRLADITRVVFVVVVAPPLNEHEDSENDDDLMRRAFNPVKEADILSDEEAQVFFAEIQTKTRGEDIRRHASREKNQKR